MSAPRLRPATILVVVIVVVVAFVGATSACGILGLRVPCTQDRNCPSGACVDGVCTDASRGEGEGVAGEGEGAATGEGEGEGEGAAGEGEGEGEGGVPNACNNTVFVPPTFSPDLIVSPHAAGVSTCFTSITDAIAAAAAGDDIFVDVGIYDATVEAAFPLLLSVGVTIEGVSQSAVVIGPTPVFEIDDASTLKNMTLLAAPGSGAPAIVVGPDAVTLDSIHFDGVETAVDMDSPVTLTNVETRGGLFLQPQLGDTAVTIDGLVMHEAQLVITGNGSYTIRNSTFEVDVNNSPRLASTGNVTSTLTSSSFVLGAGAGNNCQAGVILEQGIIVLRGNTFATSAAPLPCAAVSINDNNAVDIDLGTDTSTNAGNNTFHGTPDLSVSSKSSGSSADYPAVGNTWSHAPSPLCGTDIVIDPASNAGTTVHFSATGSCARP